MGSHQYLFSIVASLFFLSANVSQSEEVALEVNVEKESALSSIELLDMQEMHAAIEEEINSGKDELMQANALKIEPEQSLAGFIEIETAPLLQQSFIEEVNDTIASQPSSENTLGLTNLAPLAQMSLLEEVSPDAQTPVVPTVLSSDHQKNNAGLGKEPIDQQASPADLAALAAYDALQITGEEKQIIGKILTTMAESNVVSLWFQRKELESMGQQIHHIHPIRFLGTVFSNQRLVNALHYIRQNKFKWDGFIEGFSERFKQEAILNNIHPYISGLANHINVNAEDIRKYCDKRNYEGLIIFLINAKISYR